MIDVLSKTPTPTPTPTPTLTLTLTLTLTPNPNPNPSPNPQQQPVPEVDALEGAEYVQPAPPLVESLARTTQLGGRAARLVAAPPPDLVRVRVRVRVRIRVS